MFGVHCSLNTRILHVQNIQLHYTYVCVLHNKKTCVNKDFTVTVVVNWQSCLPEIFCHGWGGGKGPGHRLSRFKKSAGDRAVNDGKTSVLIQSWPTLWEKKYIYTSEMLRYIDEKYCYIQFTFLLKKTKERKDSLS